MEDTILGEEQVWFRKCYNTTENVFVLHLVIELYKCEYCAFIDYRKVFDIINRPPLWQKPLSHDINGKLLNVIRHMYAKAKSYKHKYNLSSKYLRCNVVSGEIYRHFYSPSFSMIVHNLLVNRIIFALLYADDTLLLSEKARESQLVLDYVHEYSTLYNITVDIGKTRFIVFSRGKVKRCPTVMT